jgi:hypothetical protein
LPLSDAVWAFLGGARTAITVGGWFALATAATFADKLLFLRKAGLIARTAALRPSRGDSDLAPLLEEEEEGTLPLMPLTTTTSEDD